MRSSYKVGHRLMTDAEMFKSNQMDLHDFRMWSYEMQAEAYDEGLHDQDVKTVCNYKQVYDYEYE